VVVNIIICSPVPSTSFHVLSFSLIAVLVLKFEHIGIYKVCSKLSAVLVMTTNWHRLMAAF
jgi:hypothetical protein